jgi:hypothetical protein
MPITNFFDMTEAQRKAATSHSYKILRRLADIQIGLLDSQDKKTLGTKDHFIIQVTKSFWKDFDFAYSLRLKKYDFYAVYPVRTMMEKLLKMVQFNRLSITDQDEIVTKELLLEVKRNYDLSGNDEGLYAKLNTNSKYPDLTQVNDNDLKAFQSYEQLCNNFSNKKNLYGFYRWLSGIPHGNVAHLMFQRTIGESEYRRIMMMGIYFAFEMLLAVDINFENTHHLEIQTSFKEIQVLMGATIEETISQN